jgi:hypothetical protein
MERGRVSVPTIKAMRPSSSPSGTPSHSYTTNTLSPVGETLRARDDISRLLACDRHNDGFGMRAEGAEVLMYIVPRFFASLLQ